MHHSKNWGRSWRKRRRRQGRKLCVISSCVPPDPNPHMGPMTEKREQAPNALAHKLAVDTKVREAIAVPGNFNADANRTEPECSKLINAADEQFAESGMFRTNASRRQTTWGRRYLNHIAHNGGLINTGTWLRRGRHYVSDHLRRIVAFCVHEVARRRRMGRPTTERTDCERFRPPGVKEVYEASLTGEVGN